MFSFKQPDKNITEKKRIQDEAKQLSDEAVGAAQVCLSSEAFNKYVIAYEKVQAKLIEELVFLDMTETDPVKYGFACKDIVSKYRHIGSLLRAVKKDAGK